MPASLQDTRPSAAVQSHRLVQDLHSPNPRIYWTDMLLTAVIGWCGFAGSVSFRAWSVPMFTAIFVCICGLYRGLCFLHEISHLRTDALRGFTPAWNILFGIPLLLPSFMYVGVHQYHHSLATYGTDRDPEYLPFSGRPVMIIVFALQSLLIPLLLLVRFFLLVPVGLIFQSVHRWLCVHFSALSFNAKFRREISDSLRRTMRHREVMTIVLWGSMGASAVLSHVAWRCLIVWYVVSASAAVINTIRTLGAHRYTSNGTPLDRSGQLSDSIDTPGAIWTELWAPVGLRYHALHHYFPGIPYHNLNKAYRKLTENLPADAAYRQVSSPGLPHSLDTLCRGKQRL
jgi:fatty acid desaturase